MKVTCQSCQAKYTIADEKVRGKVAKIRCKKCGTTIIVDGADGQPTVATAEAPVDVTGQSADEQWSLVVAEGDEREVTVSQLAELYAAGTINETTLAWKQGMPDWLPIGEVAGLRSVAEAGRANLSPADALALSSPPGSSASAPREPASSSRARPGEGVAARRVGRAGAADLFAAGSDDVTTSAAASPLAARPIEDKPTGARNENSVLFSLSALTGGTASPVGSGFGQLDANPSSARADLSSLVRSADRPLAPAKNKLDDIMNLGGGALYSPALMAPSLTAPSIEFSAASDGSRDAKSKNKSRLMLGLGGAVIFGGAVAAFGAMSSSAPDKPKAASAETATTAAPATAAPPSANDEPAEKPPAANAVAAAAPTTAPPEAPTAVAPGQAAPKTEVVEKRAARAERAEKPDKPDTPAPVAVAPPPRPAPPAPAPAAPAAASTADFDRAAALSALSAAATAAQSCKRSDGPTGAGRITVTFANNGSATTAAVEGPPFAGTPVGGCVAARFRGTHVPPFAGSPVTVHKSFNIN